MGNASASLLYVFFGAQWLAYALPCRCFTPALTGDVARLGADVVRYSFIAVDLRHLLLAGLPPHTHRYEELCRRFGMTPTCNNAGITHENDAIEGSHGHLKCAIADALLKTSSADFDALAAYRGFDEIVSRQNASNAKRIDIERAELQALPDRRSSDYEEVSVRHIRRRFHAPQGILSCPHS
jgi:hypothetical protein